MGELMSVLDLLRQTASVAHEPLHVLCDSQYAINVISKWTPGWKRKGWRKADGKAVMNVELVKALDEAMLGRKVTFEWVKGHTGHALNEAADERARAAATAFQAGRDFCRGPGYPGADPSLGSPQSGPSVVEAPPDLFSLADEPSERAEKCHASINAKSTDGQDHVDLVALERRLLAARAEKRRRAIQALVTDDWQEVTAWGERWNRLQMFRQLGRVEVDTEVALIELVEIGSEAALLLSTDGDALISSVWVRSDGHWRQKYRHSTRVP